MSKNRIMKQFLGVIILLMTVTSVYAYQQPLFDKSESKDSIFAVYPIKPDTVSRRYKGIRLDAIYRRAENGTLQLPDNIYNRDALQHLTFRDTMFYNPLYLPVIFNGKMLPCDLNFYSPQDDYRPGLLIPQEQTFAPQLKRVDFRNSIRRAYFIHHREEMKYSVIHFESAPSPIREDNVLEGFNPFRELISTNPSFSLEAPKVEGVDFGRKYWIYSGEHSLQFSQNYFSDNWHKGGTSNLNINSYQVIKLNYKKDRVRFNNIFEWRLSVYNAPEDTVRQYRIGQDLIRYFGDYGIDAFLKNWSYSANVEARSQLFNNYLPNSNDLRSAFLSPLYVNVGVGLKYNLDKKSEKVRHRRTRINLHLAPISMNFRYVYSDKVDVTRYGIEEGRKTSLDIGSTITGELIFDFNRYITWTSRLKYFTSYHKTESELENTLNMAITNAFSTQLYLNMRYDDSVPPDAKYNYLQLNEMISFGLNYKW